MLRSNYLGFLIFAFIMVIFFVIPEFGGMQKPFRIALCLSFPVIYLALLLKKEISYYTLLPVAGATLLMLLMDLQGTLQSSYVNAYLCLFGLLSINVLLFELTTERKANLRYLFLLSAISFLLQFLIFSHSDGRPKLAYELNEAGAYLFLFFIAADILGCRWGKLLVIALSLFLLSRLLIFSIIIYYLVKYGKKYFTGIIAKLSAATMAVSCFVLISILSLWYTSNIHSTVSYETGFHRIVHLNDGSNQIRFKTNTIVLKSIFSSPTHPTVLLGYGSVQNFLKAQKADFPPHNELFDSLVQFGLLVVILFALVSLSSFNKLVSFSNIEYFIPILFYTSILWVRYLLIPGPEMLFILFLLFIAGKKNNPAPTVSFVTK
jgi:hypothetical protein